MSVRCGVFYLPALTQVAAASPKAAAQSQFRPASSMRWRSFPLAQPIPARTTGMIGCFFKATHQSKREAARV